MSLKTLNFLLPAVHVRQTKKRGRGVFTHQPIAENAIIEIAPVIVLSSEERKLVDKTLLHDYIFEWGEKKNQICMALGLVPIYNHSYSANCEYAMNFKEQIICIKAVRNINADEELFINYNGDWNEQKKVWFDAK